MKRIFVMSAEKVCAIAKVFIPLQKIRAKRSARSYSVY